MKTSVKQLSLVDLIIHRQGSLLVRLIHFVFGVAVSIFFRRIELYDAESLPEKSGLIFVSNHPNALIDPLLLFVALPRNVSFLAKSTLFKMPVIGFLIRAVGALPLYRQQDAGPDVSKNQETFTLTRELLKKGGAIALFPEGVSHDSPKLLPLKTGAARIGLGAVSVGKNPQALDLKIVPVGLYYTNKTTFRSEALLHFGRPIDVLPVELDEHGHPPKEAVKELTAKIETGLREVTVNAETEDELEIARVAEQVWTSMTPHEENLAERLDILQTFLTEPNSEGNEKLEKRLAEYDRKLRQLGLESEALALADVSKKFVLKQALLRSWYLLALFPLVIIGTVLHFPAYQLCALIASVETRKRHFDMASTMKTLSGLVLMPLTWIIIASVLLYFFNWQIALLSIPFCFLCGWVALRSLEEISELRGWLKAITVFFLKREKFLRLLAERKTLFQKLNT
jgi:glycerol-3-phosphate O-acyltransferase/dihydroxyacetone phosphate acyltransferase